MSGARAGRREGVADDAGAAIALWSLPLDVVPSRPILSVDERARAARFRHARDRERWVAARSALRDVLGRALGRDPASIAFELGPDGKPGVAGCAFNLAHSGELALVAVGDVPYVGVDVEAERALSDRDALAQAYFTERERAACTDDAAFLAIWTRKEAVLKATGQGLTVDLRTVDVGAEAAPRIVDFGGARVEVRTLSVRPGYVAALATPAARTLGALRLIDYAPAS